MGGSNAWARVVECSHTPPDLSDGPLLALPPRLNLRRPCRSLHGRVSCGAQGETTGAHRTATHRIARYSLLPSLTSSIFAVEGSSGGFAVVIKPPASSRMAMPAATSLFFFFFFPKGTHLVSSMVVDGVRSGRVFLTTPNTRPPTRYRQPPWPCKPDPSSRLITTPAVSTAGHPAIPGYV